MKECLPPFTPSPSPRPRRGWAGDSRAWVAALVAGVALGVHYSYPGGIRGALPRSVPPPTGLGYFPAELVYTAGVQGLPTFPTVAGGPVERFVVRPELPEGLHLDLFTGAISGRPLRPAPPAAYQVTALGFDGSSTCQVSIRVVEPFTR